MSTKKNDPQDESTTMRVNRKTLRMIQIIAAWKNLGLAEYVDYLVRTQGAKDLEEMRKDITKF